MSAEYLEKWRCSDMKGNPTSSFFSGPRAGRRCAWGDGIVQDDFSGYSFRRTFIRVPFALRERLLFVRQKREAVCGVKVGAE